MHCQYCQSQIDGSFKFCPHCGEKTQSKITCFSCGKDADPSWVTCPYCGNGLRTASSQHRIPTPLHGNHYDSSSNRHHRKKKGLLGGLFSS